MSKTVCKNIVRLRQTKGISQTQLAARLNLSAPALSKIETGVTVLSLDRLLEIAKELGTTASELIAETEKFLPNTYVEEINALKKMIEEKDTEILLLYKKLLDLYEAKIK
ncbi:helix-turn-helix domain-containing protein [Pedobacter cryoconitis]|uniref:Transcriptional regulator with XRE-family HTH domain n=1 Tax=Pedobacter cryoconitis TaxID=188932 RepID=A0A7X0MJM4_9SPHI|nr:helix-turn-helix transcriptional regulator [Pedobacter cryoconitis]MBB6501151.1 transcriptional regulator with XRE-family HTH domain [Pedobacter cryoconitis]